MNPADEKWQRRFMRLAVEVSAWSKDTSTKVGCVLVSPDGLVLSTGYNGIARGVDDKPVRLERPQKYLWTVHAEAAAIANAARHGARLTGATAYVTHCPCASCARLLLNAGVAEVVTGSGLTNMPAEEFDAARTMFQEAGVHVHSVD